MKIEIKATSQGVSTYCVIELPDVIWYRAETNEKLSVNTLPRSIHQVDLMDDYGNKLTLRQPEID